jgi:hypothetical protein
MPPGKASERPEESGGDPDNEVLPGPHRRWEGLTTNPILQMFTLVRTKVDDCAILDIETRYFRAGL